MLGALFRTMGPFAPSPRLGRSQAPLWCSEEHVQELFGNRVEFGALKREMLAGCLGGGPARGPRRTRPGEGLGFS
jgi:hypothetical protein